jgi:SAM-dependent methyltransferase
VAYAVELSRRAERDLEALPFNDGTFDMVFNEGVIEHFADPLVPLKEMVRVSSNVVLCLVPNARNLEQARQAREQMEKHAGTGHWSAFEMPMKQEDLANLFLKAGLEEVESGLVWADPSPPQGDYNYRLVMAVGRKA